MANSYLLYTGNGSTTQYSLSGIDGWISTGFLKVYFNDNANPEATNTYTFVDLTTSPKIQFNSAPANNTIIRIQRETPATVSLFRSNVVDFEDTSILTAADLDKSVQGLIHVVQEANDTGSGALPPTADGTHWNAESKRITNTAVPTGPNDAATKSYVDGMTLYGTTAVTVPQAWTFSGDSTTTDFTFSPAAATTDPAMFIVEVGGTIQRPTTDYTVTSSTLSFVSAPGAGTDNIRVRNLGVTRAVQSFPNNVTFGQNITVAGNIYTVNGVVADGVAANFVTATSVTPATLYVSGNSTMVGTLGVTGATTLSSASVGGTLNVTGATTLGTVGTGAATLSSLGVTNNATVGGTLSAGASTLSSLGVTNNATVGGNLSVNGLTILNSSLLNGIFVPAVTSPASTEITLAGIPAWAHRVTVVFSAISTTGSANESQFLIRVGNGSLASTGYVSQGFLLQAATGLASGNRTDGFVAGPDPGQGGSNLYYGQFVLVKDFANSRWIGTGQLQRSGGAVQILLFSGHVNIGVIDRVGIRTCANLVTFDSGEFGLYWE